MPQSLSSLLVHLVFSTKDRAPIIPDHLREELHSYIGGIISQRDGVLLAAGSMPDHIHLLISLPRTIAAADLVKEIKSGSSKWLKDRDKSLHHFHRQNGYGIFSISATHCAQVEHYINNQAEHHRIITFSR